MTNPAPLTFDDIAKKHPGDPAAQLAAFTEIRERAILALPDTVGDVIRITAVMQMLRAQVAVMSCAPAVERSIARRVAVAGLPPEATGT